MSYRRLLDLARPHVWRIAIAIAILVMITVANLKIAQLAGDLVGAIFDSSNGLQLNRVTLAMGAVLVARMLLDLVARYNLTVVGERIMATLRQQLFANVLRQELSFFHNTRIGEITSRMTNDVGAISQLITSYSVTLVERSLLALGALALMFMLNWRLTVAMFVTAPALSLISRKFGGILHRLSRALQEALAGANSVMEEALGAIRVVQVFVREPYERDRFDEAIEEHFEKSRHRARIRAFTGPLTSFLLYGSVLLMLWLGGREVAAGRLEGPDVFEFLLYAFLLLGSFSALINVYLGVKSTIGATERVFELLERAPQLPLPAQPQRTVPMQGALTFEAVRFGYDADRPVVADIDFSVAPGEIVALVGVSGIGKSTLFDLIPRYYDVVAGAVRVDGIDVRQWDLAALRGGIASVPQETVLFAGSVRDNLRYGRLTATDSEIEAAARAANAHGFISDLPQGYETLIGERGVKLSGGQRQRIAIARALLKSPAILLLDEATSSLDSESERAVQQALDELLTQRSRTTLVIAHRLSTIRTADRIIVLAADENRIGRIVEIGSHAQLLAHGGHYAQLYQLQFQESATPQNGTATLMLRNAARTTGLTAGSEPFDRLRAGSQRRADHGE
ncbi:MAG: ABC transporter ATP-binding protein [Ardenticatenales bacterium]|nr:ABC transporter ATP-binding protein [Ardenticatenales bacterium]